MFTQPKRRTGAYIITLLALFFGSVFAATALTPQLALAAESEAQSSAGIFQLFEEDEDHESQEEDGDHDDGHEQEDRDDEDEGEGLARIGPTSAFVALPILLVAGIFVGGWAYRKMRSRIASHQ